MDGKCKYLSKLEFKQAAGKDHFKVSKEDARVNAANFFLESLLLIFNTLLSIVFGKCL